MEINNWLINIILKNFPFSLPFIQLGGVLWIKNLTSRTPPTDRVVRGCSLVNANFMATCGDVTTQSGIINLLIKNQPTIPCIRVSDHFIFGANKIPHTHAETKSIQEMKDYDRPWVSNCFCYFLSGKPNDEAANDIVRIQLFVIPLPFISSIIPHPPCPLPWSLTFKATQRWGLAEWRTWDGP